MVWPPSDLSAAQRCRHEHLLYLVGPSWAWFQACHHCRCREEPRPYDRKTLVIVSPPAMNCTHACQLDAARADFCPRGRTGRAAGGRCCRLGLAVMNISGRLVGRVCTDAPATAGANTSVRNGRSATVTSVPNGRYLVRVTARAEDGSQSQVITPMTRSR